MTAKRKTRARRRRAAIEARALDPVDVGHNDFLTDGQARFKAYSWAIAVTFGYGVVADNLVHRPANRVNLEALVVCSCVLVAHHVLYYARRTDRIPTFRNIKELFERVQSFEHWGFASAITASVLAAFISLIAFAGAPAFQAKILDYRLQRSAKKILVLLAQTAPAAEKLSPRYEKIESIIDTSQAYHLPVDTKPVLTARQAIWDSLARQDVPEDVRASGWSAMATLGLFADYRKVQDAGLTPQPPSSLGLKGDRAYVINSAIDADHWKIWLAGNGAKLAFGDDGFIVKNGTLIFDHFEFVGEFSSVQPIIRNDNVSTVIVKNSEFRDLTQDLRAISWVDVRFENSTIVYSGGALNLKNVSFENCNFRFGTSNASQELLRRIQQAHGQPITFAAN